MTTFDVPDFPDEPTEGTVLLDCENTAWQRIGDLWLSTDEEFPSLSWHVLWTLHTPLVVLWDGKVRPA